jgi:3-oxoadipate enol-lactonase
MITHDVTGPADAPVLVLGNSLGTTSELWEPQLAALGDRFRVVRYNYRGHGGSPAPAGPYKLDDLAGDLLELLDSLGVDRFSYAGVSIGGMVGMWLGAHARERVARLALVCTSARFESPDPWLSRAAQVRAAGIASIADQVVSRWFTPGYAREHPDLVRRFTDGLSAVDDEGYAGCCEAIAAMDLHPVLPTITAPVVVIAGADDPAITADHGAAIAAAIPGATLTVVADAAHLANVERAEEVNAILLGHLT